MVYFAAGVLIALVTLFFESAASQPLLNLTQYVNPFIGTEGQGQGYPTVIDGGNVFPGAALPFGVVKFGVDTTQFDTNADANAGYTPDGYGEYQNSISVFGERSNIFLSDRNFYAS